MTPRSNPAAEPMITVIIPTYNYAHFVDQAIQSVIDQTYPDWECIVVDDGSTDGTRDVVARFVDNDARISYVFQDNKGLAAARNTGLKLARGRFIQFLDSDDLIEKEKLRRQLEFVEAHEELDIVYGNTRYFRSEYP